jgi:hypothetical protein
VAAVRPTAAKAVTDRSAAVVGQRTTQLTVRNARRNGRILTLTRRRPTKQFDLVGATWSSTGSHDGAVEVRVRRGTHWTGWQHLSVGTGDGGAALASADAATNRRLHKVSASPLWVGSANAVQSRVVAHGTDDRVPSRLHLVLINGGRSTADATPTPVRSRAKSAAGPITAPTIYTRADWNAQESLRHRNKGCGTPEYASTIKVGFVHHTDTGNSYSRAAVPSIIRSIYRYHVEANGWCDIGYNFLVDRFGRIWQGRYGGNSKPVIGAHTGGFNTDSFGVAMIGTFDYQSPDAKMRAAVARVIAWRLATNYRDPKGTAVLHAYHFSGSRYRAGRNIRFNVVSGHRNADYTDCPGRLGYRALPSIRTAALADIGAGLLTPSAAGSTLQAGSGSLVSLKAKALVTESWTLSVLDANGDQVASTSGKAKRGAAIIASWNGAINDDTSTFPPAGKYYLQLTPSLRGRAGLPYISPVTVTSPLTITGPATAAYNSQVTISGAAPAGTLVTVSITDELPVLRFADAQGNWSATFLANEDRTWSASANISGTTYSTTTGTTKVAPVVLTPAPVNQTITSGSTTFTLQGSALPSAATVSVISGKTVLGTVPVAADGSWSVMVHTAAKTTLKVTDGRGVSSPTYAVIA